MIGEIQIFLYTMRKWIIYDFYCIKAYEEEGLISVGDYEALEEDIDLII